MQPVDRAAGYIFGHLFHMVVESPVVAIEVAFPLGEEVRDDGMEISGQNTRTDRSRRTLQQIVELDTEAKWLRGRGSRAAAEQP